MQKKLLLHWSHSTYSEEVLGRGTPFSENSFANVYLWSFSQDIVESMHSGKTLGCHKFMGNEVLNINFSSDFAQGSQQASLRVYAFTEQMLEISSNNIKKQALN